MGSQKSVYIPNLRVFQYVMLKMFGTLNLWVLNFVGIKCGYSIYVGIKICVSLKLFWYFLICELAIMGSQKCGYSKLGFFKMFG